jgi:hypothetical protein
VSKPKDKAWLGNLDLRGRLLVFIGSCQSRYESSCVSHLRYWWPEKAIRLELRALQYEQLVDLMALDRVRWALTSAGRNAARRAREQAQKAAAA